MENEAKKVNGEVILSETPNHLIALALDRQADPNTLSKLMDLQERWEAGQARRAYVAAMTAFKQEAPAVLKKGDQVDFTTAKGRTHYNYANLGSIVQEITAILGKHELSAAWGTSQDGPNVTVTCHVTHIAGHRESVTLTGPIDESGNKNRIQAVGSTVTYLQRYTLLAALGLATGEDDDSRQGAEQGKPPVQMPKEKGSPSENTDLISEAQRKRFYAIAKSTKATDDQIKEWLFREYDIEHSKDIPKNLYDEICTEVLKHLSDEPPTGVEEQ